MPTAFAKGRANQLPGVEPPEGVQLLEPGQQVAPQERFKPRDEDEEFLYGPTQRPEESVFTGVPRGKTKPPPPATMHRWLPILLRAAEDPNASPELHAMIRRVRAALED